MNLCSTAKFFYFNREVAKAERLVASSLFNNMVDVLHARCSEEMKGSAISGKPKGKTCLPPPTAYIDVTNLFS